LNSSLPYLAEELIAVITEAKRSISDLQAFVDTAVEQLSALRELGLVTDKISCPAGTASFTIKKSWSYSPAVKQLQEMEQLEGIATMRTSSYWTIRAAKAEAT